MTPTDRTKLADFIEDAKPGWLPISGHVVNITFSLQQREMLLAALRVPETADAGAVAWRWQDSSGHWHLEIAPPDASDEIEAFPLYASPTAAGIAAPRAVAKERDNLDIEECGNHSKGSPPR